VSVEDAAKNICGYLVEAEIHGPDVKRTYGTWLWKTERERERERVCVLGEVDDDQWDGATPSHSLEHRVCVFWGPFRDAGVRILLASNAL
jgi:hypothetical protein